VSTAPDEVVEERRIRIAVLGSCITRDSFNSRFNPEYKLAYEAVLMQNQSSIISVMSEAVDVPADQIAAGSAYDRWNVRTDLSKEFLGQVVELAPDYLVLDFFGDIHFGVLDLGDGRYITNNRWKLWPTPYYKRLQDADAPPRWLRIDQDTDEYVRLWRSAYDRLVEYVRRVLPGTAVVVHRGHNTDLLSLPGAGRLTSLSKSGRVKALDVPLLNRLWSELDDYAVSSTGFDEIDLTGKQYPTSPDHPWGAFYVHYSMDYYPDFLAALGMLHLRRVLARPENQPGGVLLDQLVQHLQLRAGETVASRDGTIVALRERLGRHEQRLRAEAQTRVSARVRRAARAALGPRLSAWVLPVVRRVSGR
jgi:hypothetical protein